MRSSRLLLYGSIPAGVTAVLLALQRRSARKVQQEAIQRAEALATAKLRAQLAESAASIGKLAAAVTHEINSPLGILKSSVDTLLALEARHATAPLEDQRLVEMQAELRRAVQVSAARLEEVIERLQRFTHLDEDEPREADLNDLLRDATLRVESELAEPVHLELDCHPLPRLQCRPQSLSFAFFTLLTNAVEALDGSVADGGGRIWIVSRSVDSNVEVSIRDNGRGMPASELDNIFDPAFKVDGQRVRSGNWSLFNSRQIVFEHGGDIQISSALGKGTKVTVTLPCIPCASFSSASR